MNPLPESPANPTTAPSPQRLASLDAFRGAIMLLMASSGLGLPTIAREFPDRAIWSFFGHHTDHVLWSSCSLWD